MAEKVAELYADFSVRTGDFDKKIKQSKKKVNTMNQAMKNLGKTIAAGFGAKVFLDFAKSAVSASSALEETLSKFNTVFASTTLDVEQAVSALQNTYAMSEREARAYLASTQDLLVPMGIQADLAAALSEEIVKLSADLGSFNNLPTAQVMADIQSALVGNFETTKKYGVVLNETVIKEEARRQGLIKGKQTLNAAMKAQVAFDLILDGSKFAIGDMERTAGSYANQLKKTQANIEDFTAAAGVPLRNALTETAKSMDITSESAKAMGTSLGVAVGWLLKFITTISGVDKLMTGLNKVRAENARAAERNFVSLNKAQNLFFKTLENTAKKNLLLTQRINADASAVTAAALKASKKRVVDLDAEIVTKGETWEQYYDKLKTLALNAFAGIASLASQTSQVFQMAASNDLAVLDNKQTKRQNQIDKEFEAEKLRIDNLVIAEEDKNDMLMDLDSKRARESESVALKFEKKKRKIQRDAAKTQKTLSMFETALAIPNMAVQSYKALAGIPVVGPGLGIAAALAATALGVAKLKLISEQPLPALAAGGVVSASQGGSQVVVGEGGKDELVAPLTKDVFLNFARGLVDAVKEDQSPSASIVEDTQQGTMMIHNQINIGTRTIYDDISEAMINNEIQVPDYAVVSI